MNCVIVCVNSIESFAVTIVVVGVLVEIGKKHHIFFKVNNSNNFDESSK